MTTHALSFAQVTILDAGIAEVVVDAGVEVSGAMVEEWLHFMRGQFPRGASVLLNKRNRYAYSFDAQVKIGQIDCVHAVAIVSYDMIGRFITRAVMATFLAEPRWKMSVFDDRERALEWLRSQAIDRDATHDSSSVS